MRVIIDTSVWSLALRRRPSALSSKERQTVLRWREIVAEGRALLLGMVRQELLSGIRHPSAFDRTLHYLREFDDEPLDACDYEQAARCACVCRAKGIAFSPVDMLICGVAIRNDLEIMTVDHDFFRYARYFPLTQTPI